MSNKKTAMQELFEKYGHLLPDIEDEFLLKESSQMAKQTEIISECKECGKEGVEPHYYFDELCDTCGAIEMLDKIAEEKYEQLNNK